MDEFIKNFNGNWRREGKQKQEIDRTRKIGWKNYSVDAYRKEASLNLHLGRQSQTLPTFLPLQRDGPGTRTVNPWNAKKRTVLSVVTKGGVGTMILGILCYGENHPCLAPGILSKERYTDAHFELDTYNKQKGNIISFVTKIVSFMNFDNVGAVSQGRATKSLQSILFDSHWFVGSTDNKMAYYGKVFKFQKQENYESFVRSLGIPDDKVHYILKAKPSQRLVKNGDTYTMSIITGNRSRDLVFKSGVEFDENITDQFKAKSIITVTGDTVHQVQKFDSKRIFNFIKEFSGNSLKETITSNFWEGAAYRYYST